MEKADSESVTSSIRCESKPLPLCKCCGRQVVMLVTRRWTENYGRRFYRCPELKRQRNCHFEWVDDPYPEAARDVIGKLKGKLEDVEGELLQLKGDGRERNVEDIKVIQANGAASSSSSDTEGLKGLMLKVDEIREYAVITLTIAACILLYICSRLRELPSST